MYSCRHLGWLFLVTLLANATLAVDDMEEADPSSSPSSAVDGSPAKKHKIELALSQIANAQQNLDAAKAKGSLKQPQIDAMQQRLDAVREAVEFADSVQTLRKNLRELEETLAADQPANSDFGKARAEFLQAKEKRDDEFTRIVDSAEYRKRVSRIQDVENAGAMRHGVRKDMLDHDMAYQNALIVYRAAKKDYARAKAELFSQNAEWNQLTSTIREGEEKEKRAKELWSVKRSNR